MLMSFGQFLAIAAVTNHTLIVPDILFSSGPLAHLDGAPTDVNIGAKMSRILDVTVASEHFSIISLRLHSQTWSHHCFSCLQLLLHIGVSQSRACTFFFWWMRRYENEAAFKHAPFVEVPVHDGTALCNTADDLVDTLVGSEVIGVVGFPFGYTNAQRISGFGCGVLNPASPCCAAMNKVCADLRHSTLIEKWATEFMPHLLIIIIFFLECTFDHFLTNVYFSGPKNQCFKRQTWEICVQLQHFICQW